MTTRDRTVLLVVLVLVVLAAGWLEVVSPQREKAAKLDAEVSAAQSQLSSAQSALNEAKGDQSQYTTAYASVVKLGQAVPADEEVPSLVFELDVASAQKDIEFNSIATSTSGGSGSGSSSSAAATAAAASAGFTQMPFTFIFHGDFFNLERLLGKVQGFTLNKPSGVAVSGRLLTIQSIDLERKQEGNSESAVGSSSGSSSANSDELTGTITATAYVLPPGQTLTGGAGPGGPAGASAATTVSGSSSSSSTPATPAVVKVTP